VLWQKLIDEWQLSPAEADYIDRQQGESCTLCGSNLRSIALGSALLAVFGTRATLSTFVVSPEAGSFAVLELNTAGTLNPVLSRMPGHVFGSYPEVDLHALPYRDMSFDLVVHSDTLEHVANPVHALSECRRVLKLGGALCFTVPVVVGRLSRDRSSLPKSYHGNPTETGDDLIVQTEFGADAWTYVMEAGFSEIGLFSFSYPAALAIAAYRKS
jgi:SAM-dependent methyltransferase